jgi:hypothetical protein
MSSINDVIRRTSTLIDTSGHYPSPAIQTSTIMPMGGGVYPQNDGSGGGSEENVLVGRISLGMVAAFIVGAVAFYVWTNSIQGGG